MISIKKQQSIFTLTENWFGYRFKWSDIFLPVCYRGLRDQHQRFYFGIKKFTKTIVLPIDKPFDELYSNFSTTLKYDIKKAQAAGVCCEINQDAERFVNFYNEFARVKQLYKLDPKRMNELAIPAWKSSFAVLDGQILAAHSYLEDKESGIVRLMESGSMRLSDAFDPKQIAQANKLLHLHDIQYFHDRGLRFYDFGGWDDIPGLLKFKEAFGAFPIDTFNFFSYAYELKERIKKGLNK